MMIRYGHYFFIVTALLSIMHLAATVTQGETGVTIKRVEEATLDKLLADADSRLLISFMAAWCGPCIDELPTLSKLHRKYKKRGLKIIGISIDLGGPAAMQPAITELKIDFPVYWFGEKSINKFKLNAIPMLLIIRQGKIVERMYGKRTEKFLDKKIQELLR
ncbi:MAG: TlpA family protein disulfide reductase [Desulfobacterales bacterium]|nr:TlpA family protein disulfide reductase [Desulfobacterales bacterium]